jgi:AcrR family transcriptional regulator
MPKVSQEHLDRRREQIIAAARECFAKDGFHDTSMQDIFRAAGLSAGAVYRYFPSKNSLIMAIAEEAVGSVFGSAMAGAERSDDVADAIVALAGIFAENGPLSEVFSIIVQVWAGTFLDPEMAAMARALATSLIQRLAAMLPEDAPPEAARLVLAAIQGFAIQTGIFGDVTPELVTEATRAAFGLRNPSSTR